MALAIAAGAFGAHAAADAKAADWLATGSLYQMAHGLGAWMIASCHPRLALLLLGGAFLFAATLYAMAAGAPRWLGAITPIGGAMMIIGWLLVAIGGWLRRAPD
jgi:uncharacterized membrane protein YgdD (TMEM256/DUF423 family)